MQTKYFAQDVGAKISRIKPIINNVCFEVELTLVKEYKDLKSLCQQVPLKYLI